MRMVRCFTFLVLRPSCTYDKYQYENVVSEPHGETELNYFSKR